MLAHNEDPNRVFYHKIDVDNIGITGFSQGGAAVFNALTKFDEANSITHGSRFSGSFCLSAFLLAQRCTNAASTARACADAEKKAKQTGVVRKCF